MEVCGVRKVINMIFLLIFCSNICAYGIEFDNVDTVQNIDYSQINGGFECITYEAVSDLYAVAPMSLIGPNTSQAYFTLYNTLMPGKLTFENIVTKVTVNGTIYRCAGEYTVSVSADTQNEAVQEAAQIYYGFISDFPELFYLNSIFLHSYNSYTSQVTISPVIGHDLEGIDVSTQEGFDDMMNKYYALENKIEEIADEIYFEGMTDLDKLLLTHDYITDNCVYYLDENGYMGDWFSHNAYGAIMNKQAVCQGYAYSYKAILKKLGYDPNDIHLVSSTNLGHMWNLVKLNGKWYHVDSTWDDPLVKDAATGKYNMNNLNYQITLHSYFLIDTQTNYSNRENYSFDMSVWGYDNSVIYNATDTTYLSGYIFNEPVNSSSQLISGKIEYSGGYYKKYYSNSIVYFLHNSIKSSDFVISQPAYNKFNKLIILLFGANQKTVTNTHADIYVCCYNKNGTLLQTSKQDINITYFGEYPINIEIAQGTAKLKLIAVKDGTITPIANVPAI